MFTKLKDKFLNSMRDDGMNDALNGEDYVEIDTNKVRSPKEKIIIRPFTMNDFSILNNLECTPFHFFSYSKKNFKWFIQLIEIYFLRNSIADVFTKKNMFFIFDYLMVI